MVAMSVEVKKRGRPSKKAVEQHVLAGVGNPPTASSKPATAATTRKVTKANTSTIPPTTSERAKKSLKRELESIKAATTSRKSTEVKRISAVEETAPPVVLQTAAIEESKILKELAENKKEKTFKSPPAKQLAELAEQQQQKEEEEQSLPASQTTPETSSLLPPLKPAHHISEEEAGGAHLLPTNTLAMGIPIPSSQALSHPFPLLRTNTPLLPWLPTPHHLLLTHRSHLSTTRSPTPNPRSAIKSANEFVVSSSLPSGPAKREMMRPGQLPPKYKPAARRVTAIIVALPIVIVSSWMLYERLVLGTEQKKLARLPPAPPADAE